MGAGQMGSREARRPRGRFFLLSIVVVLGAAVAIAVGCGLDDSDIVAIGGPDATSADVGVGNGEGGRIGDGGNADVTVCTPETCASYTGRCQGGLDNGCGGTLTCACPNGQGCIDASSTCDGPPVCMEAGAPGGNCGEIVNPGNGLDASCGACANPGYTCSASAACTCVGNVCGANCCNGSTPDCNNTSKACCTKITTCVANTCNPTNNDGCGGNLSCSGNCTGGTMCGTNGYVCDTPLTCTNKGTLGGSCGTLTTTHGVTTDCGTCAGGATCSGNTCACASGKSCNGTCCAAGTNVCDNGNNCCAPEAMTTTCTAGKCGNAAPNNCQQAVDCGGTCNTGDICAGGTCTCGGSNCNAGDKCCFAAGHHFCHGGGVCN